MKRNRLIKGVSLILLNTIIWGIAPVVIKMYMDVLPSFPFLFYRFLIVMVVMFIWYFLNRKSFKWSFWLKHKALLTIAFFQNALVLIFLFIGISYTNASIAAIVSALSALIAMFLGPLFFKEHVNKNEKAGNLLTFLGFLGLVSISFSLDGENHILGLTLIVLGNLIFLISIFWLKYYLQHNKIVKNFDMQLNFVSFLMAFVTFAFLTAVFEPNFLDPSAFSYFIFNPGVLYMGILSSIVAMWAYNASLKYLEVSEVTYFSYLQPLFTMPLAYLLLHENTNWPAFIMFFVIILVGVLLNLKGLKNEK